MRVEDSHRHVTQLGVSFVFEDRGQIVENEAHLYAAVGRIDHVRQQEIAALVAPPHVVLQIERMLRGINQRQTPPQTVLVFFEQREDRLCGAKPGVSRGLEIGETHLRIAVAARNPAHPAGCARAAWSRSP